MEEVKIMEWIKNNSGYGSGYDKGYGYGSGSGSGYGYGSGYGKGYGYGSGSGSGDGYGSGYGKGYGYGSGSGSGDGYGDSSGFGYGYGHGDGSGFGYGYGYGDDNKLKSINGDEVFNIDNVPTIIKHTKGNVAKGFIVNCDFTYEPCYIVKGNGYFAHGKTIREAQHGLVKKYIEDMDEDEVIGKFVEEFEPNKKYKGSVFFNWHHYLTGSCLMGRESFVKNHDLNLDDEFTVDEFIELTINDYGGEIIEQLKEQWDKLKKGVSD